MGNAMTDLALANNLSTLPREFFPDYEEQVKPEPSSSTPSPLDCLLARENDHRTKTEPFGDTLCVLPSAFYRDGLGTYSIFFPLASPYATREGVKAYVSPETPEPRFQDDCREILPKLQPIRMLDKCSRYEGHGKRGRKPLYFKNERTTIRKPPPDWY